KLEDLKAKIIIEYETAPSAESLQWLTKEQTHGKEYPYLFSQCQAIHARSLLPCQDTPFVKTTYTAKVSAPRELTVLMSALQVGEPKPSADPLYLTHEFNQKIAIPSYLIAIVAGNIQSKELGPRSRVWSERAFLELAATDFADTEQMLATAEKICGDYVWGRYDILVLPPSFPYGGMENPCLTFVTPTLLTGDKSLADVIAHEITHSWTGNLVTNKNFEHFWLNEGFTRFIERKIVGRLGGEARRQFSSHLGWSELIDCVKALGPNNPLTQLVVDLRGVDPEDAFSRVPYEKGSNFLYFLEQKVGGAEIFERFLKIYIADFAHKSIDTEVFKTYFIDYFSRTGKHIEISDIDWDSWLLTPGMPIIKPDYDTSLLDPCIALKDRWDAWDPEKEPCPFELKKDLGNLDPNQIVEFLNQLIASEEPFTPAKAQALNSTYKLKDSVNTEILFRWIRLACKAELADELPLALDFVTKHGRMKFIQPIYRDLHKWEAAPLLRQQLKYFLSHGRSPGEMIAFGIIQRRLHADIEIQGMSIQPEINTSKFQSYLQESISLVISCWSWQLFPDIVNSNCVLCKNGILFEGSVATDGQPYNGMLSPKTIPVPPPDPNPTRSL
ncbi:unnamed protein product, partial [Allacma fusca]